MRAPEPSGSALCPAGGRTLSLRSSGLDAPGFNPIDISFLPPHLLLISISER
jgi:hypothetical protein